MENQNEKLFDNKPGRGRGRGLRQPINTPIAGKVADPYQDLGTLISALSLESGDPKEAVLIDDTMKFVANNTPMEEENWMKIFQLLYARCFPEWKYSGSVAGVCAGLVAKLPIDEADSFLICIVKALYEDLKGKEQTRTVASSKLLSSIAMLCQLFARFWEKPAFKILINVMMASVEMILDKQASDKEMECSVFQLAMLSSILPKCVDNSKIETLKSTLRGVVLDGRCSSETKLTAIKILETLIKSQKSAKALS